VAVADLQRERAEQVDGEFLVRVSQVHCLRGLFVDPVPARR
jgi:hypothetical protein